MFLFGGCARIVKQAPEAPLLPSELPPPQAKLSLDVVYPRLSGKDTLLILPRVDSSFAFGSVQPGNARLWVNGDSVRVWQNGAFLAFVPLDTIHWRFHFMAETAFGDSIRKVLPFRFREASKLDSTPAAPHPRNRNLPARLLVTEPHAVMRKAPYGGYWLFPPPGSVALADSFVSPYFRVALGDGRVAWIEERYVQLDSTRHDPPQARVKRVRIISGSPWTQIEIQISEGALFQLQDQPETGVLSLNLFRTTAAFENVQEDPKDSLIGDIGWKQKSDSVLHFEVRLKTTRHWGYDVQFENGNLILKIRKPPRLHDRVLEGRMICLDAGHGGAEAGAIGPTRLYEKDANLDLTLKLAELLREQGAKVLLTRSSDSTVALYDRVDFAVKNDAEILLSVHNNALADGENPFVKHGAAVYYYQPQSRTLAEALQRQLVAATGLADHGVYHRNLALARPTQMPAALIECAFIMHPDEEALLREASFIAQTAAGLVAGLQEYLENCKKEPYYRQ